MRLTANTDLTDDVAKGLCSGEIPVEFVAPEYGPESKFVSDDSTRSDSPLWALEIIDMAKAQLLSHVQQGGPTDKKESPDCYMFEMKRNYPLTIQMGEAGWTQWQTTISTKTKEDAAAEGVRYKKYRYAVHFWVSPDRELALGKLKLEGKYRPEES